MSGRIGDKPKGGLAVILIVGGAHCGKRDYAAVQLGYDKSQMSDQLDHAPVFYNLQVLLQNCGDEQALMAQLYQKEVVICDEVGCGIVPMDAGERAWRERVGRVCCALAKKADKVVRVQCGIGIVIKEA